LKFIGQYSAHVISVPGQLAEWLGSNVANFVGARKHHPIHVKIQLIDMICFSSALYCYEKLINV